MSNQVKEVNREDRDSISIVRSPSGHGFQLKASQFLPSTQDQVFEFFADAFKLQSLTPGLAAFFRGHAAADSHRGRNAH